jgi:hypothetical protein
MISRKRLKIKKIKPFSKDLMVDFLESSKNFYEEIKKLEEAKRKSWQDSKRIILD